MPDLTNYKVTAQADASLTVARVNVEAKVIDDTTRAVIADFTGANAIQFAVRVPGWTAIQHRELVEEIAHWLIRKKAGL